MYINPSSILYFGSEKSQKRESTPSSIGGNINHEGKITGDSFHPGIKRKDPGLEDIILPKRSRNVAPKTEEEKKQAYILWRESKGLPLETKQQEIERLKRYSEWESMKKDIDGVCK